MLSLNVMVVDDSMLAVKKMEAMLEKMGHKMVRSVNSGALALEGYWQCMPDFVTMDITMPEVDGIQATKNIIATFPDARIIMVTSHGQEEMVREALKAGAGGYVLKPVNEERLAEYIKKITET